MIIIDHQEHLDLEGRNQRIGRASRTFEAWRAAGVAFLILTPHGLAYPHPPGCMARLLRVVAKRPGTALLELASTNACEVFVRWALTPRPTATDPKGTN
jgi:hypothetical protein